MAILCVLLSHALATVAGYDFVPWHGWYRDFSSSNLSQILLFPFSLGQAGVPIFFVISGFCIHLSFHQHGQKWGLFFIRRFFRIYPTYFAALILFCLLVLNQQSWSLALHADFWKQFFTHLLLIHNFSETTFKFINPSFWSLAVEVQLYLVYPFLLLAVSKHGWRKTMVVLGGMQILINAGDFLAESAGLNGGFWGTVSWLLSGSIFGYWFSWAMGAWIADAFIKNERLPFSAVSGRWMLALAGAAYLVRPLSHFWFLIFSLAAASFISRSLAGQGRRIPGLASYGLLKIGVWSYSIYLLHQPLMEVYGFVLNSFLPAAYRHGLMAFCLLMTISMVVIVLSVLWYELFELPSIAFGKRIIDRATGKMVGRTNMTGNMGARHAVMAAILMILVVGNFIADAKFCPLSAEEDNNLAWTLATDGDTARRNGTRAVELAEKACQQTQYQKTIMVGTLAAAYAEAGRFDDAIATAQKACLLAAIKHETSLLENNQRLLVLYQNHQPFHAPKTDGEK